MKKTFTIQLVSMTLLVIGLMVGTWSVQKKTNLVNYAADNCSAIAITNSNDEITCQSQYFTNDGAPYGCLVNEIGCSALPNCDALGCSTVPSDPISCSGMSETVCNQHYALRDGCSPRYNCDGLTTSNQTFCSSLTYSNCIKRENSKKCKASYVACNGSYTTQICQGTYKVCQKFTAVCDPNAKATCHTTTSTKKCSVNGSGFVYSTCPTGQTCHNNAYGDAYCS